MMMKKTIAGVFASVVAVSAMATTIASAADIQYAAIDNTYNLKAGTYTAQNDAEITTEIGKEINSFYGSTAAAAHVATATIGTTAVENVVVTAVNGINYTIVYGATAASTVTTASINGTVITVYPGSTTNTVATLLTALDSVTSSGNFTSTAAAGALTAFISAPMTGGIQATAGTNAAVNANDVLTLKFNTAVKNVVVTIEDIAVSGNTGTKVCNYNAKTNTSNWLTPATTSYDDDKGTDTWKITGITTDGAHSYRVTVDYDVVALDATAYDDQNKAASKNQNKDVSLDATYTGTANTLFSAVSAFYNNQVIETATFDVKADNAAAKIKEGEKFKFVSGLTADDKGEDIVDAVSEDLEARTKAQIKVKFEDIKNVLSDDFEVTMWLDTNDFGILKTTVDADDGVATFDIADFVTSSTSKTTLGDLSNKIDDIWVQFESDDSYDSELKITSIAVVGPAETYSTIAAGAAADDTAAPIESTTAATVAPVVTAAPVVETTTAPAANPSTGNAPIALAAIPVAIAAAAVIAKKRG